MGENPSNVKNRPKVRDGTPLHRHQRGNSQRNIIKIYEKIRAWTCHVLNSTLIRYHDDGSKKLKACGSSSTWFIFNPNTSNVIRR
jgi:hypothetical protein